MIDTDFSAYESAVLDDNLEHSGGITVTWKSASGTTLPVGDSVYYHDTKYSLLDPYTPERNDALTFKYSPKYLHPICRLERVPFYIEVTEQGGGTMQMSTINFTGKASTIAAKLAQHFSVYGATDSEFASTFGSWSADMTQNANTIITVNLDGCSIKAAASRIADAVGCNVFFDWNSRTIRFIAGSTIDGASYNCFHVLGGTTNMAKKSVSGIMVPVIQRLQLPDEYEGSIIDMSNGAIKLTTDIILDDIYPKMELLISKVRERVCYITDEEGNRVEDEYGNNTFYSKWYIELEYTDGTPFSISDVVPIADKPLSILFQPNLEDMEHSSVLAGHQFEVVHYGANKTEWGIDDVLPETSKWQAKSGEFRIIFKAEGSQILPSTSSEMLCPAEGDKVTLVNVSLSEHYKEIAQTKLEEAAESIIAMMMADSGSYRQTVLNGAGLDVNQSYSFDGHSGIITDLNMNLHTKVADVTVGTWKSRKTLSGGVRDKIDSINVTTTGGNQGERGMSKTQFDALNMAQPKGVVVAMKNEIDLLGTDIDAIRDQEDKKFEIWFGMGVPTNSTYPASSWTTDEDKALHVQDIYYDTERSPASQGGRAYRYMKNESNNTYGWERITDLDTESALEKIADVASDGVICGGAEKQRVYIDWHNCLKEYTEYSALTQNYGIDTERTAYMNAYKALWELLNGGSAPSAPNNQTYETPPAWIAGSALSHDTYLAEDYSGTIPSGWTVQQVYRQKWNDYYETLAALLAASDAKGQELTEVAKQTAESKLDMNIRYDLPPVPYKIGDLWWKLDTNVVGNNEGVLYMCIRNSGETASMNDWIKVNRDYFDGSVDYLATLAELLETNISAKYVNNKHSVAVSWGTEPENPAVGDVWYDSVNEAVKEYSGSAWASVDPYAVDVPNTINVFKALMAYDSQQDRSVTFFEDPQYASGAQTFDVCFKRATFHDNFTNSDVEGGFGVWVNREGAWQRAKENVSGLMENYGDHIIASVFGNQVDPTDPQGEIGLPSYAAGFTTSMNFAEVFAQKAVVDPVTGESELKAKAGIAVHIETETDPVTGDPVDKGYVDVTGSFRSADEEVVIQQITNPGHHAGDSTKSTTTTISVCYDDVTGDGILLSCGEYEKQQEGGSSSVVSNPNLQIKEGSTSSYIGYDYIEVREDVSQNNSESSSLSPTLIETTGKYGIRWWIWHFEGVGTVQEPVKFKAKDLNDNEVTVIVVGGIILHVGEDIDLLPDNSEDE